MTKENYIIYEEIEKNFNIKWKRMRNIKKIRFKRVLKERMRLTN